MSAEMGKSRSLVSSCQNLKLYTGVFAPSFWLALSQESGARWGRGAENGWVHRGLFLSVCVPPGRGADTAGAPSSQEAGKCLWVSSSWKRFEALWQMFAVPATSLLLETKPRTIPDQSLTL